MEAGKRTFSLFIYICLSVTNCKELFSVPEDYDKYEIPHYDTENPWTIETALRGIEVTSIDYNEGTLKMDVVYVFKWIDPRLNMSLIDNSTFQYALNPRQRAKLWVPEVRIRGMKEMRSDRGLVDTRLVTLSYGQKVTYFLKVLINLIFSSSSGLVCTIHFKRNKYVTERSSWLFAILVKKCNFDFSLYPVDFQVCTIDLQVVGVYHNLNSFLVWSEEKRTIKKRQESLPLYYVKVCAQPKPKTRHLSGGLILPELRMYITLERQIKTHVLQMYLPSSIFVIVSWGSFVVPPEMVPGRMALLVTNLLSLVTMIIANRASSPPSIGINFSEVWLVICIMFLFLALLEYTYILTLARKATLNKISNTPQKRVLTVSTTYGCTEDKKLPRKNGQQKKGRLSLVRNCLKKLLILVKNCFTQNDKEAWGIQDRVSIILFPAMFVICLSVYISTLSSHYMTAKETKGKSFLDCWAQ